MSNALTPKEIADILSYATTDRQIEVLEAITRTGSLRAACRELGMAYTSGHQHLTAVRKRAATRSPEVHTAPGREVPDGYRIKGVSTYYDKDGKPRGQWVKSKEDHVRMAELQREIAEACAVGLPQVPEIPAGNSDADNALLMACYPIGDLHVGMLSWAEETGEDWDLSIAEQVQCGAMRKLVQLSPACPAATIINLGDWFHADNFEGVTTRSGHRLDMDSRYPKMARVGVRIMRTCIEEALKKHQRVRVINVTGNHDDTSSVMLSVCLSSIYEGNPRVEIDTTPAGFHFFRHGRTLVGLHHGHSTKIDRLPGVMAADRAKDWGETEHRYWWIGHVHHQSVKDFAGVTVESFRTLAAKDAYASWGGYRAPRDMKCILLHQVHGEVGRFTVSAAQAWTPPLKPGTRTPQ